MRRPNALLSCATTAMLALAASGCRSGTAKSPDAAAPEPEPAAPLTMDPAVSAEATELGPPSNALPPPVTTETPSSTPASASSSAPTSTAESSPAPAESLRGRPPLSDAQLWAVAAEVNAAAIDQARVARGKVKDPAVRRFVETLLAHHERAKRELAQIRAKRRLEPAESGVSTELDAEAAGTLATLKKTPAKDFDAVYLETRVAAMRKVLTIMDEQLAPDTGDVDLRAHLQEARRRIQEHLDRALAIQAERAPKPVAR